MCIFPFVFFFSLSLPGNILPASFPLIRTELVRGNFFKPNVTEHTSAFKNEVFAIGNSAIGFASSGMYNPIRDGEKESITLIYLQAIEQ